MILNSLQKHKRRNFIEYLCWWIQVEVISWKRFMKNSLFCFCFFRSFRFSARKSSSGSKYNKFENIRKLFLQLLKLHHRSRSLTLSRRVGNNVPLSKKLYKWNYRCLKFKNWNYKLRWNHVGILNNTKFIPSIFSERPHISFII